MPASELEAGAGAEAECVGNADVWSGAFKEGGGGGAAATGGLDGVVDSAAAGGCVGVESVEAGGEVEGRKTKGMVPSRPVVLVLMWGIEREVRWGRRKVDVQPAPRMRRVVGGGVVEGEGEGIVVWGEEEGR